ncbi:hypothetical protein B0J15DRAFT_510594 [Fusarium solani]|uniref:Uncharacterized protein n=1 Tax=Fusarium solani TaxID=169388 RepID=A0A9P9KUX5_FUSSL|nr:uncharacterized protein B0J15DRAFT_510594 [Fusarium solani]KAH7268835.1 hypothetical protein B0J15DRAFT_510594 [Fusarium solani]
MGCEKKRKQATPGSHPPGQPDPALYQQQESMMFRLPQELRLKIYAPLFSSKRLQWSTLAFVRTCRQIRDEISNSWIGQIHLTFKTPQAMLDVLTELPVSTLSKIKHAQVTAKPLLTEPLPGRETICSLLVQGTNNLLMFVNYLTLDELISKSCGWKELYWQCLAKPSVTIYRSTLCDVPGVVLDHDACVVLERDMPSDWIDELPLGTEEEKSLAKEGERGKEMMVVAKRGFGVDYEEKEGSLLLENDIRRDAPGMAWQEIQCINMQAEFPPQWLHVFAVQMGIRTGRLMQM